LTGLAPAQEKPAAEPPKPAVEQISPHEYKLGDLRFNSEKREIRLPALVNTREDALEYILVHSNGKTHESLFKTPIPPTNLQVVLKLLRFKSGKGKLFDGLYPPGQLPTPEPEGDPIAVFVSWDGTKEVPVTELVEDFALKKPMKPDEPWIYNGSEIVNGQFQAEVEGSIIALYLDSLAIMNTVNERRGNDENWFPITKLLPPYESPATIILRPAPPRK